MSEKFTVTPLFVEIYKLFNVVSQVERLKNLSRKELLLMLTLAVDTFSEDNHIVIENITPFKDELKLIYDLQQDNAITDEDILYLAKVTGEKYIDSEMIVDSNGDELPEPLSEEEAIELRRDINITEITEK